MVIPGFWSRPRISSTKPLAGKSSDDGSSISSVYSLAVQREGLWLLSGLESGGINLQSVRHDEGKRIACLRGHTSAVSVLNLAQDETSVLSGSWDKVVLDWDLNTGKTIRKFEGSGGQISALEIRPLSSLPVPEASGDIAETSNTLSTDTNEKPRPNGVLDTGVDGENKHAVPSAEPANNGDEGSPNDSLFGDGDSLFGDNDNDFTRMIANGIQEHQEEQEHEREDQDAGGDTQMPDADRASTATLVNGESGAEDSSKPEPAGDRTACPETTSSSSTGTLANGLPHAEELPQNGGTAEGKSTGTEQAPQTSDSTFLAAGHDGSLRIWDKRQPQPIAKMSPGRNVPPWCTSAVWSPDGNFIYAGRRNGTVDEYSLHKGLRGAERSFKLPNNSGAVSALRAMPNGRHLIWLGVSSMTIKRAQLTIYSASHDILRLYDLQEKQIFKHATVPFLIVPGHRTGVVSHLYMDPTCRYLISAAGNRGWEGSSTEVMLGYEIGVPKS
jgi:transcriptional activator SPT8